MYIVNIVDQKPNNFFQISVIKANRIIEFLLKFKIFANCFVDYQHRKITGRLQIDKTWIHVSGITFTSYGLKIDGIRGVLENGEPFWLNRIYGLYWEGPDYLPAFIAAISPTLIEKEKLRLITAQETSARHFQEKLSEAQK